MTKLYYNAGGSFEKTGSKSAELSCESPKDEACVSGCESGSFVMPTGCYFPFGFGSVTCRFGETICEKSETSCKVDVTPTD